MKKSVVILIAVIYVAAVALVSFFGLQFKVFEEIVYVESIEILNEGLKDSNTFGKYAVVTLDENGEAMYQIEYRVRPDNATNQSVNFVYDKQTQGVSVDENGIVKFTAPGMVIITLTPKDGTVLETETKITIIAR